MDVLLTLGEAAKIMRVSRSKAQKMAKAGVLPFRKLGATWVIPQSALYRELGLELPHREKEPQIA